MELDELKNTWLQHEKQLVESTRINKELIKSLLIKHADKRIDWLRIRTLSSLILPLIGIVFIVIPRIQFTFDFKSILGLVLFGSLTVLSYIWLIRFYLYIEKINLEDPITKASREVRTAEKYKLKITKNSLLLAPFMIIGVFLSADIQFLSPKMIPFYVLCVIVFLISSYIRTKYGVVAQLRKIERDIEEISKLELDTV